MRLSTLLAKTGLAEYASIQNEQDFDLFAPITTEVSGENIAHNVRIGEAVLIIES